MTRFADYATRPDTHAEQCRQACQGQEPVDLSDYRARMNKPAPLADLREPLFDYSDDGPGALFMMLVCFVITCAAIGAAFYFI